MYKCKECGLEYNDKPLYCDCGNDDFEIITAPQVTNKINKQTEEESLKGNPETINKIESNKAVLGDTSPNSYTKTTTEQASSILRHIKNIDPFSGVIFVLCIIISFYIIFYAWNADDTQITDIPKDTNTYNNIPSIDKLWNNTAPADKEKPVQKQTKEVVSPEIKKIVSIPSTTQKNTVKLTKSTKPAKQQTVSKPNKPQTSSDNTVKNQVQKIKTPDTIQKETKSSQPVQTIAIPKTQKTEAEIAAEKAEQAKQNANAKLEYANYKTALRNTIGKKIDFTKVVGDGNCTVAFRIDATGKLINRSFSKQSSNITLNDAVYAAVMSTPSYSPPPSAYKNETLNLNISFYNGNFEISLR